MHADNLTGLMLPTAAAVSHITRVDSFLSARQGTSTQHPWGRLVISPLFFTLPLTRGFPGLYRVDNNRAVFAAVRQRDFLIMSSVWHLLLPGAVFSAPAAVIRLAFRNQFRAFLK